MFIDNIFKISLGGKGWEKKTIFLRTQYFLSKWSIKQTPKKQQHPKKKKKTHRPYSHLAILSNTESNFCQNLLSQINRAIKLYN
jgi:hypothetical protein